MIDKISLCRALLGFAALTCLQPLQVVAQDYEANEVARAEDGSWSVEDLGQGVHLFRWWPGFYVSPFVVGDGEVLAVDPVSRDVALLYREAIAAVTDAPVTKIIYSHDHRDHIVGADVLAPDAEIYAHPGTLESLQRRGDSDVPLPTQLVDDGDRVSVHYFESLQGGGDSDVPLPTQLVDDGDSVSIQGRSVGVHYFGPNHGDSNIAMSFDTDLGRMLVFVDTLEIGIVPYRTLPDTNVHGYIASLRGAAELEVDWVLGGHSGPGPAVWIENYLNYFLDMEQALIKAEASISEPPSDSVEDVIAQGEVYSDAIIARAIDELRPTYGHWRGFEAWAPLNAQTVRMYLITGN